MRVGADRSCSQCACSTTSAVSVTALRHRQPVVHPAELTASAQHRASTRSRGTGGHHGWADWTVRNVCDSSVCRGQPASTRHEHCSTDAGQPQGPTRRSLVLQSAAWPLVALLGLEEETVPSLGDCPTCIGPIDGTLGSCAGLKTCMSSYDDRPGFFIAPWQHDMGKREKALDRLQLVVEAAGGKVEERTKGYLHVTFNSAFTGTDDVEFLLPKGDTTIELRAASRRQALPDIAGRLERRFEALRTAAGFETVPVLRNRQQVLGIVDSPFDSFGPTPPTDLEEQLSRGLDNFMAGDV